MIPDASEHRSSILVVDDTPENLKVLSGMLRNKGYEVRPVTSGKLALKAILSKAPDLMLLDINMPDMDGYQLCEQIKLEPLTKDIPVIFISALSETLDKVKAFSAGGLDYITKPFQFEEVNARVETHLMLRRLLVNLEELVKEKVQEITASQMATILAMAKLAQSRDDATGTHLERVQAYCKMIANEMILMPQYQNKMTNHYIELVYKASALHDIGKVGIPDALLLKPGKLSTEEFEQMKEHTLIGASTLEAVRKYYPQNEFVEIGIQMARSHHEKWDGTGYPDHIDGERIPLSARIMAIADVYDALKSVRCYKEPFTHEECCKMIASEKGKAFDPDLVDVFIRMEHEMLTIWETYQINS